MRSSVARSYFDRKDQLSMLVKKLEDREKDSKVFTNLAHPNLQENFTANPFRDIR
jgi:hypothetical protein